MKRKIKIYSLMITIIFMINFINGWPKFLTNLLEVKADTTVIYNPMKMFINGTNNEVKLLPAVMSKNISINDPYYSDNWDTATRKSFIENSILNTDSGTYNLERISTFDSSKSQYYSNVSNGQSIPNSLSSVGKSDAYHDNHNTKLFFNLNFNNISNLKKIAQYNLGNLKLVLPYNGYAKKHAAYTAERPEMIVYRNSTEVIHYTEENRDGWRWVGYNPNTGKIGENLRDANQAVITNYEPGYNYSVIYWGTVPYIWGTFFNFDGRWDNTSVLLVDEKRPTINSITTDKLYYKKGEVAEIKVNFSEPVRFTDGYNYNNSYLKFKTFSDSNVQTNSIQAKFYKVDENDNDGKTMTFQYAVPDNTNIYINGIDTNDWSTNYKQNLLYYVCDLSGNQLTRIDAVENSTTFNKVVLDSIEPYVKNVSITNTIVPNNAVDYKFYKAGDTIYVHLIMSEKLESPSQTILDNMTLTLNNGVVLSKPAFSSTSTETYFTFKYVIGTESSQATTDLKVKRNDSNLAIAGASTITDLVKNTLLLVDKGNLEKQMICIDNVSPSLSVEKNMANTTSKKLQVDLTVNDVGTGTNNEYYEITITPGIDIKYQLNDVVQGQWINVAKNSQTNTTVITGAVSKTNTGSNYGIQNLIIEPTGSINAQYTMKISVTDKAKNVSDTKSLPFVFENTKPTISFKKDESVNRDKLILGINVKDDYSNIKSIDYKVMNIDSAGKETPESSDWVILYPTGEDTAGLNINKTIETPLTINQINKKRIIVRASDIYDNSQESQFSFQFDNRDAACTVNLPTNRLIVASSFDITIAAKDNPKSYIQYQWVKDGDIVNNDNYRSYDGLTLKQIGDKETQKSFNNNKEFHGKWTLYLRAIKGLAAEPIRDENILEMPSSTFKFNNENPSINIVTDKDYNNIIVKEINDPLTVKLSDTSYSDITEAVNFDDANTGYSIYHLDSITNIKEKIIEGKLLSDSTLISIPSNTIDKDGKYIFEVSVKGNNDLEVAKKEINIFVNKKPLINGKIAMVNKVEFNNQKILNLKELTLTFNAKSQWLDIMKSMVGIPSDKMYVSYSLNNYFDDQWYQLNSENNQDFYGDVTINGLVQGINTIYYKFKNCVGAETEVYQYSFELDTITPKGSLVYSETKMTSNSVEIVFNNLNDEIKSKDDLVAWIDGKNPVKALDFKLIVSENSKGSIYLRDVAGNVQEFNYDIKNIDKIAPMSTFTYGDNLGYDEGKIPSIDQQLNLNLNINDYSKTKVYFAYDKGYYSKLNGAEELEQLQWVNFNDEIHQRDFISYGETIVDERTKNYKINFNFQYIDSDPQNVIRSIYLKVVDEAGNVSYIGNSVDGIKFSVNNEKTKIINSLKASENTAKLIFNRPVRLENQIETTNSSSLYKAEHEITVYDNRPYKVVFYDSFGNQYQQVIDVESLNIFDKYTTANVTLSTENFTNQSVEVLIDGTALYPQDNLIYEKYIYVSQEELDKNKVELSDESINIFVNNSIGNVKVYKWVKVTKEENSEFNYLVLQTQISREDYNNYNFEGTRTVVNYANRKFKLSNIDKTVPTAEVKFMYQSELDSSGKSDKPVIVRLINISDNTGIFNVRVVNNSGSLQRTFEQNGEFTFILEDTAGNRVNIPVKVDNIINNNREGDLDYSVSIDGLVGNNYLNLQQYTRDVFEEVLSENQALNLKPVKELQFTFDGINNNSIKVEVEENDGIASVRDGILTVKKNGTVKVKVSNNKLDAVTLTLNITNIDNVAPNAEIVYLPVEGQPLMKAYLRATDNLSKSVKVSNVNGVNYDANGNAYHDFDYNGQFTFYFQDEAGNKSQIVANAYNLDLQGPSLKIDRITPSPTSMVNSDMAVIIKTDEQIKYINIIGDDKGVVKSSFILDSITLNFKENAKIKLEVYDLNGNKSEIQVIVDNIDKDKPVINYEITNTENTVVVTFTASKEVYLVENDEVNNSEPYKKIYKKTIASNGIKDFTFMDKANNSTIVSVNVTGVDSEAPILTVTKSTEELVKDKVDLIITASEASHINLNGQPLEVKANEPYLFTVQTNGLYTITATDKARNKTTTDIEVNNIDKVAPTLKITGEETPILEVGNKNYIELLRDVESIDNFDGILTNSIAIDVSKLDINSTGAYTVTYTVSDKVGNTQTLVRYVRVASKDQIIININNTDNVFPNDTVTISANYLSFSYNNNSIPTKLIIKKGEWTSSQMKYGAQKIDGNKIEITEKGLYTVMLQTQERYTQILYVNITK